MREEPPARTRASAVLFVSVALGNTSFVASITVAPLVAHDLSRSATLAGLPWSAMIAGTGIASIVVSRVMARHGRLRGLIAGYAVGVIGAVAAVAAIVAGRFDLFLPAVVVIGAGNAANQLTRYAAAELYPPEQRASALGRVVWAGTIGGVAGPALLAPTGRLAVDRGLPSLAGPLAMTVAGFAVATVVLLLLGRSAPVQLRAPHVPDALNERSVVQMWREPRAQVALIALAASQAVMVMIMAMTPLHIRMTGHGLGSVGLVTAAHVFGMYAFSPVSGWLADRFGPLRVVIAGFAVIAIAALTAAAAPEHAGLLLAVPLLLLGIGWSFAFVSGSALLTQGLASTERTRLQGATDSVVWIAAATAGLGSGVLIGSFSYALLCVVGAVLVALPVALIVGRRRAVAAVA